MTSINPARLLIQINDSDTTNTVYEFEIEVLRSRPSEAPDAKYDHEIDNQQLVIALRAAADEWDRKTEKDGFDD